MALKRFCRKQGCKNLTEDAYCEKHAHQAQQDQAERHRHYDQHRRNKELDKFYHSLEWQRVREQALIRDKYLCQDCLQAKRITPAGPVDHIKPVKWFWHLRLTLSNLRSLCQMHHNRKTAEDKRRYGG